MRSGILLLILIGPIGLAAPSRADVVDHWLGTPATFESCTIDPSQWVSVIDIDFDNTPDIGFCWGSFPFTNGVWRIVGVEGTTVSQNLIPIGGSAGPGTPMVQQAALFYVSTQDCGGCRLCPDGPLAAPGIGIVGFRLATGRYGWIRLQSTPSCEGDVVTVLDYAYETQPETAVATWALPTVTRHVPAEYPTIQAAIDAANFGDTVEIADGTYTGPGNRDLRLYGKPITVRSAGGDPSMCVIDCELSGRGFDLAFQETPASVIEGLTITNGQVAGLGGAILCTDFSGATIRNCVLSANSALPRAFIPGNGGALCVAQGSTVTLDDCTVAGNTATGGINASVGGGIACFGSSVELVGCMITGNSAGAGGGGIYAWGGGTLRLTQCVIDGNTVGREGSSGGGVSVAEGTLLIARDCTFSGNSADFGGAVAGDRCDAAFWNTAIVGNEATFSAGGVSWGEAMELSFTDCTIRGNASYMGGAGGGEFAFVSPGFFGCTISDNESRNDHDAFGLAEGGGLAFYYSYPTLVNCTFTNNLVSAAWLTRGAALRFSGEIGNTASLYNCVFAGNFGVPSPTDTISAARCSLDLLTSTVTGSTDGPLISIESGVLLAWNAILAGEGDSILLGPDSSAEVSYSNVAGGWAGTGNIDADPQFANPAVGDFRLTPGSPCIDTGSTFVPPDLTMDRDGNPRIVDGDADGNARIDMGAYEFQPCAGDLDGNRTVGLSDLAILLSHFGEAGGAADGDLNRDGNVDLSDLALLLGAFGTTCP